MRGDPATPRVLRRVGPRGVGGGGRAGAVRRGSGAAGGVTQRAAQGRQRVTRQRAREGRLEREGEKGGSEARRGNAKEREIRSCSQIE